jgi:hypothetical protein
MLPAVNPFKYVLNPMAYFEMADKFQSMILRTYSFPTQAIADFNLQVNKSLLPFLPEFPGFLLLKNEFVKITKILENQALFANEVGRKPLAPEIDVPYRILWQDERVLLKEVIADAVPDAPTFALYLPVMRGPFLSFYTEYDKPDKVKSIGKALLTLGAGRVVFTDWKPLNRRTREATLEDYIETYHAISQEIKRRTGESPINIDLCQPGYFDILRLAKYPDDALITVLVGSPHKCLDPDSILYDTITRTAEVEMDRMVDRDYNGLMPGKVIANFWGVATPELIRKRYLGNVMDKLADIYDGTYDKGRVHTFEDWINADVRDVPGPVIKRIFRIFKYDQMLSDSPLGFSQKNYKNPLFIVIGRSDNIVTGNMARSVFEYTGAQEKREYQVEGGHAAVFSGSKSIRIWREKIIPDILMTRRKMLQITVC